MQPNSIKKVNLDQLQKPRTLIVIHYKGKRVSIPLFDHVTNITEYLWAQLYKFETTVLLNQPKESTHATNTINNVVGFTAYEQEKGRLDIKMNILLSMARQDRDYGRYRADLRELDITKYYKYLEIEPYYGFLSKQLIPEYAVYSVLSQGQYYTVYLARRVSDGRFYSVKVARADSKLAQNEYTSMKVLQGEQSGYPNKKQLQIIPQIQEIRKNEGLYIYIYEYCPGGSLRQYLSKKLNEIECLHYMKQLIWGVHVLHTSYNLLHRALCLDNVEVDFVGNLRLANFAHCQPCYASAHLSQSSLPESYEQRYEIKNVVTPPEVRRSGVYNNLVDYFGVGVLLHEMFVRGEPGNGRDKEGIEIAIENLMSENIKERQFFVNEILGELKEHKMSEYSVSKKGVEDVEHERLAFNKIYVGESVNVEHRPGNGIKHDDIIRMLKPSSDDALYFLNPISKSKTSKKSKSKDGKQKTKSKSKSKDKKLVPGKLHPSNSITVSEKSLISKKSSKSVDKSMDSKKNSSKESRQKSKNKKEAIHKQPPIKTASIGIPKSPPSGQMKQHKITATSPTHYLRAVSPKKLYDTKNK